MWKCFRFILGYLFNIKISKFKIIIFVFVKSVAQKAVGKIDNV